YLISFFMSSVLPGTITGDALRVYGTRKEVNGSANAALIVLLERFLGLFMLMVMGCASWFMIPTHPEVRFSLSERVIDVLIITCFFIIFVISYIIRYYRNIFTRFIVWIGNIMQSFLCLPSMVIRNPIIALKIISGTFIYQS